MTKSAEGSGQTHCHLSEGISRVNNTSDKVSARKRALGVPGCESTPAYVVLRHKCEIVSSTVVDFFRKYTSREICRISIQTEVSSPRGIFFRLIADELGDNIVR
jgi:hypothetical protein